MEDGEEVFKDVIEDNNDAIVHSEEDEKDDNGTYTTSRFSIVHV